MIDIVAILFSPKVTPSGLTLSGITSMIINKESFGSYIVSSIMSIVNTVSCPIEESKITFDDKISKSAPISSIKRLVTYSINKYMYLLVAVSSEEVILTLKLVVKALEAITVMFNLVPSVTLYLIIMNDTYRAV